MRATMRMTRVTGIDISQSSCCEVGSFVIVFMPEYSATNDIGRKMMVTVVKTRSAVLLASFLVEWLELPIRAFSIWNSTVRDCNNTHIPSSNSRCPCSSWNSSLNSSILQEHVF